MFDNVRLYRLPDDYVITAEPTEIDVESPTEGVLEGTFVAEQEMKADLLQMLATSEERFSGVSGSEQLR